MVGKVLRYRFEVGQSASYELQMRVTVQVESAGAGAVTQVAEVRGRIGLAVVEVDGERARIDVSTEHLEGEVPNNGFFDQAAVGDPLASLPGTCELDAQGGVRSEGDQGSPLHTLFPPLPEGPAKVGGMWAISAAGDDTTESAADDPGAIHVRFIGPEPDEGGVLRDVLGLFSGHAWSAADGVGGVRVQGETRRMSEVQLRREDGWAQRVDARVETRLALAAPDGEAGEASGEQRTIDTVVELLLMRQET